MSVKEQEHKPEAMAHFPDQPYRWLELHEHGEVYGWAAIADREDDLELHLSLSRWGPGTRRALCNDFRWLQKEARALGKQRILGIRADVCGRVDPRFFRFVKLFGVAETWVFQVAAMNVGSEGGG